MSNCADCAKADVGSEMFVACPYCALRAQRARIAELNEELVETRRARDLDNTLDADHIQDLKDDCEAWQKECNTLRAALRRVTEEGPKAMCSSMGWHTYSWPRAMEDLQTFYRNLIGEDALALLEEVK